MKVLIRPMNFLVGFIWGIAAVHFREGDVGMMHMLTNLVTRHGGEYENIWRHQRRSWRIGWWSWWSWKRWCLLGRMMCIFNSQATEEVVAKTATMPWTLPKRQEYTLVGRKRGPEGHGHVR